MKSLLLADLWEIFILLRVFIIASEQLVRVIYAKNDDYYQSLFIRMKFLIDFKLDKMLLIMLKVQF